VNTPGRSICLLLAVSMAGCTTLQPVGQPAQFIAEKQPSFVVITTDAVQEGDDPLVINAPRVQEGQLSGLLFGEQTQVPFAKIHTVQAKQFNKKRTIYFGVASAFVLGGITFLAIEAGNKRDDASCVPDGRFLMCDGPGNYSVGGLKLKLNR
jgi:hypothetical protein